jgi:DNA-binding transcriptional MerR regulator
MAFTIKQLESLSGIKAHTIRIWEQRYNFLKPSRTQTNIRVYSNDELKTLLTVSLLNKYGYKISRIDQMQPAQRAEALLQLPQQSGYDERIVNEMIGHTVEMDILAFEKVLNKYVAQHGIEDAITGLIFHFLERVGLLWQANRILPVQEHVISNIIRQKIVNAIEQLPLVQEPGPSFLLFLPEHEYHELGLLFVYYLLRKKNIPVIYLGANVPIKDVHYVIEIKHPAYIYVHLTSYPKKHELGKFLQTLGSGAGKARVLLSGPALQAQRKNLPKNFTFLSSISEAKDYIGAAVV